MYTKSHKNRVVDPPPLTPREAWASSPAVGRQQAPLWDARLRGADVVRLPDPSSRPRLLDPRSWGASPSLGPGGSPPSLDPMGALPFLDPGGASPSLGLGEVAVDRPPRGATAAGPRDRRCSHARGNSRHHSLAPGNRRTR
jgi:hypothetical protein